MDLLLFVERERERKKKVKMKKKSLFLENCGKFMAHTTRGWKNVKHNGLAAVQLAKPRSGMTSCLLACLFNTRRKKEAREREGGRVSEKQKISEIYDCESVPDNCLSFSPLPRWQQQSFLKKAGRQLVLPSLFLQFSTISSFTRRIDDP